MQQVHKVVLFLQLESLTARTIDKCANPTSEKDTLHISSVQFFLYDCPQSEKQST
jgi:hypothetical protein